MNGTVLFTCACALRKGVNAWDCVPLCEFDTVVLVQRGAKHSVTTCATLVLDRVGVVFFLFRFLFNWKNIVDLRAKKPHEVHLFE